MKFVKFGIFTLALGMFVASCGGENKEEAPAEDTTMMETAPVMEEAPAPMDTTMAPAADTTMAPAQ